MKKLLLLGLLLLASICNAQFYTVFDSIKTTKIKLVSNAYRTGFIPFNTKLFIASNWGANSTIGIVAYANGNAYYWMPDEVLKLQTTFSLTATIILDSIKILGRASPPAIALSLRYANIGLQI